MATGAAATDTGETAGRIKWFPPALALTLTALFWAGNWVTGRGLHEDVPPLTLNFGRWVVACVLFLPFALRGVVEQRAVIAREWPRLTLFALLGVTAFGTLTYSGLQTTTSINGALLNSTTPIFVIMIAWCGIGDRTTWRQGLGVAISMLGVLLVISRADVETLIGLDFGIGDLVILAAIFSWSLYSALLRHWPSALRPKTFFAVIMMIGFVFQIPLFAYEQTSGAHMTWSLQAVAGIVYIGSVASVAAFLFWNYGVRAIGAGKASMFLHLLPVFAAGLAMLILDERLYLFHIAGVALILAGIYVASATRPFWKRRAVGLDGP